MEWDHFDYSRTREMRNKFLPLEKVKAFVDLRNGQKLIDIGAGDGFYSLSFASENPNSVITALEPGRNGSVLIKKQISELGIKNIKIIEESACEDHDYSPYDKVFFSNVFHDLDCREELLKNMSESMKKGSEAIFIEFRKEIEAGPPQHIRISESGLESMLKRSGFRLVAEEKLPLHYMHKYIKE
jgi:16S rRNA G527 N7-methylase RsmG